MDKILIKLIISAAIFRVCRITHLELKNGTIYCNPDLVQLAEYDRFGIVSEDEIDGTFHINISDVYIIY